MVRLHCPIGVTTFRKLSLSIVEIQRKARDLSMVQAYRVVKVAGSEGFLYRSDIVLIGVALNDDFNTLAKACQLVSNVTRTADTLELKKLLVAELLRIVGLGPLLPYIE